MKYPTIILPGLVLLLFLGACATPEVKTQAAPLPADTARTQVVLLPDPDGKVGEITIKNKGGVQMITKAGHMAETGDAVPAGAAQAPMAKEDIDKIYGAALSALPERPKTFILYFRTDSTELTEASRKTLSSVKNAVDSRQSRDISVIGHTDRTGKKKYNFSLSRSRALKVKKILVSTGVNPATIEIGYHGEANPLIKTPDGVAEPRNRRVEVTVR
ncbi:OmpA family protein [Syntrophus gentianae]|uniref:OmpA family protein n=1 Tax=Syntrophus gentianae TaxID=43775 RepID=A0A1H7YUY3_9BACT|nr:OmpA family protein [Syntrophus gentianae]SEM49725.1 OmpA family protein [Syntrophus gentianae]